MKKRIALCFSILFCLVSLAQNTDKKSTASENVSIISKEFVIQGLNDISHKVWVYLPPDYDLKRKNYPVIYMHDGQNLFDAATSYIGEWEVDESLNKLFKETGKGFIVVAVENGREERINEYTPWEHEKYGGGKGAIYVDFLVNTLKPYIDATYRTKKSAKNTAIMGSSLGGLISYYGGLKYADVFGKIGAFSPSFWFSDKVNAFTKMNGKQQKLRLYMLVGGKEGAAMVAGTEHTEDLLLNSGFNSKNLQTKIAPEGEHNEKFWKANFLEIVKWLYKIED